MSNPGGRARPIEPHDMPEIVTLYRSIAAGAMARPIEEVTRKLTECFLQAPFPDAGSARSVVHEGSDGRLVGFLGVVPRRWQLDRRTLVGVAATAMVVDPDHRDAKLSALWLTREGLSQPYDFSICDKPTEPVIKMRTGGAGSASSNVVYRSHVLPGHGYWWRLGLRPTEDARQRLRERLRGRRYWPILAPLAGAARRLAHTWDNRRPRPPAIRRADDLVVEPMTAASLFEARLALAEVYSPCLVDDAALATWQYDFLADYPSRGEFRWFVARTADGVPVGWFLYYVRRDQPSEVASVVAVPKWRHAVVATMIEHAMRDGCTGLFGTTSAVMAHELVDAGAVIDGADRLLVSARDPAVLGALRSSQALVTGLESEIWI